MSKNDSQLLQVAEISIQPLEGTTQNKMILQKLALNQQN